MRTLKIETFYYPKGEERLSTVGGFPAFKRQKRESLIQTNFGQQAALYESESKLSHSKVTPTNTR
jgi:hypothetical protein